MSAWPKDALALLAAVIRFEDEHPKVDSPNDCLCDALNKVPVEIRAEARVRAETAEQIARWAEENLQDGDIAATIRSEFLP